MANGIGEEGRWRAFDYEELLKRDKLNLDIFWLKDKSLEDSENLPEPDVLAQEIADMIGSTRQTVTSTLGQLERDGLLRIDDHKIQLTGDVLLNQLGLPVPV